MSPSPLDVSDLYKRGLEDIDSLTRPERLVFVLHDFNIVADMDGWDHSFLYEHSFVRYPEVRAWVREIGDDASLSVLDGYEAFVVACGAPFTPDGIQQLLERDVLADGPDQRDDFTELREQRWARVDRWLADRGWRIG